MRTSPPWWTLARMLVWILLQVDLPPQDAAQFCSELNPKTIEVALNALVGALFNALYGAVEGMPIVAARIRRGSRYEDLADFFQSPPSLESGALDALRNELRQFIRQQPDIQFNPTWGRWTWPVCVSAAQVAPTPTRLSESAVADEAEPIPGSAVGPEEPQPNSVDTPTPASPARSINVGVDPAIASAIHAAIKPRRPISPSCEENMLVAALDAALDATQTPRPEAKPRSSPSATPAPAPSVEVPGAEPKLAPSTEPSRVEPVPPPEPVPSEPVAARKRARRRGPKPGTIDRYGKDDRALFKQMSALIKNENLTFREAAKRLCDKIKGRGTPESRIRRLADRYRNEVEN